VGEKLTEAKVANIIDGIQVDEKACKKLTFFRRSEAKSRPIGPRKRAIIDRVRRYAHQRHNGVAMISRARGPRRRP